MTAGVMRHSEERKNNRVGYRQPLRRRQGGFSYLWLLLVIALIAAGSSTVLELQQTVARRDQERELLWIGRQFVAALESYRTAQSYEVGSIHGAASPGSDLRHYPASLEELLKDPRFPGIKRHLRRIFRDPLMGNTEWGLIRRAGRIVGIHSLSREKPIKQDGFEPNEASFAGAEHYSNWVFVAPVAVHSLQPGAGIRTIP
ncbi:MAG: type II secretion system GspH family protein [Ramlibacter sp.]|nr:type II secretion system GspH family protein [Ramlibacter sp.]